MITSNAKEIQRNIDKFVKVTAKNTTEALDEIGLRGVGILKRNTPVVEGALRNSEAYTIDGKIKEGEGNTADIIRPIKDKKTVIIGTNKIYAPKVEFLSKTGSRGFMFKSFKQLKPIANKIFKDVLGKGLK